MGGFRAVEDRPTPKEVYNWRLYLEAAVISFGSLLFGYDSAFIGTTIARDSFKRDFNITDDVANSISSNITSAFQAGAFFGAIFCFLITERVGRKWALEVSSVIFVVGAVLMTAATSQLSYIYAGRVLTGLGCGIITATVPSYIAELSVPSIRGILTGLFEIVYQVGSVLGFWINYGITKNMDSSSAASWRIPMAVQLIPAGLLLGGGLFIHESPLWLMRNDKEEQVFKNLQYLRQLAPEHQYIQEEVQMMRDRLAEEAAVSGRYGSGRWAFFRGAMSELSRKGMRNRVFLIFCGFALQNFGGAGAINYYSPTLFGSLGITDVTLYTDIIKAGKELSTSTAAGGQAATALIMIYSVFWSFGLNGIPWIVSAEIFPGALRTITGTWTACCNWLTQFIITKSLPYIFTSMGYGTWFFFGTWLLIAMVWAFFFLPETKGVSIDQMDLLFGYEGDRQSLSFKENTNRPFADGKAKTVESEHAEEL
ncbi:hypothetical protein SLS63_005653 [Diaporthe eres]|uniref:Major facilitator superfamily (MFS) profile domain-containing protein n=1 Tax=Diaporthe eres TaxID=83184 RepID=A0ABR1PBC5_DIAER